MQKLMHRFFLLTALVHQACQSAGPAARVDKDKRRYELQSQDDVKSSMQQEKGERPSEELVIKLEQRVQGNGRDLSAHINLSQAYLASGQYEKAEKSCRDALRLDPKNEVSRKTLAQIYYRRGNLEMAQIILNGLDALHSKDSQVLNLLGMIALRQNRPEFALQSFQEALKNNPSDVAVRMNLGVLYVHYRQLGLAAVEFERVLKVMPEHPDANLHLGIIESSRGNLQAAEDLYRKVLKVSSKNPVAIYNLAIVEHRRKKYDAALDYLRSYLSSDFAKSKNNQEVFVLIEKIRTEKEVLTGKQVSDDDIMKLAAKAKGPNPVVGNQDKEFVEADPKSEEGETTGKPVNMQKSRSVKAEVEPAPAVNLPTAGIEKTKSAGSKKSYRNDEEEINDLEKQLK